MLRKQLVSFLAISALFILNIAARKPTPFPSLQPRDRNVLEQIIQNIRNYRPGNPNVDFDALVNEVLKPIYAGKVDVEKMIRGMLKVVAKTELFRTKFYSIEDPDVLSQLSRFFGAGLPPTWGRKKRPRRRGLDQSKCCSRGLEKRQMSDRLPVIYEDEAGKKIATVYDSLEFKNWGQTVKNDIKYTFVPTTVLGVINIMKFVIENKDIKYRIRAAGHRHSWPPIFGQDGGIIVSFIPPKEAVGSVDFTALSSDKVFTENLTELQSIELGDETSNGKILCRVGASVKNEQFRRWAIKNNKWTLPMNAVLVEITVVGATLTMSHGGGRQHMTLADLVRKIEYVDANGKLQWITDPKKINAAIAFGVIGIITHLTYELDPMTYAELNPRKIDAGLAVPPLRKEDIPEALRGDWFNEPNADAKISEATKIFNQQALSSYNAEWLWFPFQSRVWVNCWGIDKSPAGSINYPDKPEIFHQWVLQFLGGVFAALPFFNAIPRRWQALLMGSTGMLSMPPRYRENATPTIKTALPNAIHYRRGVPNTTLRNIEVQIPIPAQKSDSTQPDFSIAQRAWWDMINLIYSLPPGSAPVRLTSEMRIMGGSNAILAPQYGNQPEMGNFGTISLGLVDIEDFGDRAEWNSVKQALVDMYLSYEENLNVRLHWGKELDGFKMKGRPALEYLWDVAFKDNISEFKNVLRSIGKEHGWSLEGIQERFSNPFFDNLIYSRQRVIRSG